MTYDKHKADFAVAFIEQLKHTKGIWHGVNFTLLPWQNEIIKDVFGTTKPNGYRQYNTAYIEVPKKNGKSELAAAIALLTACGDGERGAEVYGCAADRAQASIVFDVAVDMVDQCPALKKRIKPVLSLKRLVYLPTSSFYQVLSAEAYSKHGLNVHACIFDELHAQPNRQLYDVMTKGSGDARAQPLFFIITTAGDDPDRTSIGWEVHQKAVDVLTGARIDPTFYARIYGIEPEERRVWHGKAYKTLSNISKKYKTIKACDSAWQDKRIWKLANPSLDHTITTEKVQDAITGALGNKAEERVVRWLRLNEWIKYKDTKWLGQEVWDKSSDGDLDPADHIGRTCYGGLDLSSKLDITAFALLFPPDDKFKKWVVLPWFWIPSDCLKERVEKDKVPYDEWERAGFISTTDGNVIDYRFIEKEIVRLRDQYNIVEIAFDPWNAMQTSINLSDEGLTMIEIRQGMKSLSPPMKELEKLIQGRELEHGGNPVLRWMFGNLSVKKDENENIRPVKTSAINRIDGFVAMVMAAARATVIDSSGSVYEERGILTF